MGALPNFNFVLEQAKSKYFMWAEADDKWEPTFIEKNVEKKRWSKHRFSKIW